MAGSYGGVDLFGTGPHRYAVLPRGIATQPRALVTGNSAHTGTLPLGQRELEVSVTGRLVAASEPALWALRRSVADAASFANGAAVLVDSGGRSFPGMWFISYAEEGPADAGRVWSVAYTAVFRDFSAF